ncbi:MAG: hypothetical protein PHP34_02205 [Bacteroidales bacterium]|nr:hypothetical protein [Bacteroidales bacterium]
MKTTKIIGVLILLFVFGCKQKDTTPLVNNLKGESLLCKNFNGMSFIGMKDSNIIIRSYTDTLFEIYKIKGKNIERVKKFGLKGNGPNEYYIFATYFDNIRSDLYVLENNGKLTHGSVININNKSIADEKTWEKIDFKWMKPFYSGFSFIPESKDSFLILGAVSNSKNFLSSISISDKSIVPIDYWVKNKYAPNNNFITQRIYIDNANLLMNHTKHKFLYSGGNGKVVYIFNLKGNKVDSLIKIYDEVKVHKTTDGINYTFPEKVNWDVFTKTTDKYIFIRLYKYEKNNGNADDYKGYPYYYSDNLEIYDWNGRHIVDINFDTPFYDFIVDKNNKFILTLTNDMETKETVMRRYPIQDIDELR